MRIEILNLRVERGNGKKGNIGKKIKRLRENKELKVCKEIEVIESKKEKEKVVKEIEVIEMKDRSIIEMKRKEGKEIEIGRIDFIEVK